MLFDVHMNDLPKKLVDRYQRFQEISLDTETTGLECKTCDLSTVQLYVPGQPVDIVRLTTYIPENLISILRDHHVTFIMHHAPFDMGFLNWHLAALPKNVICTRIAEKLANPAAVSYSLKALIERYYGVEIDKTRRETPDWSNPTNTDYEYMARDVVFLDGIWRFQSNLLEACGKMDLAQEAFDHLPTHVKLEMQGFKNIYSYS